jgi:hypothetical protein
MSANIVFKSVPTVFTQQESQATITNKAPPCLTPPPASPNKDRGLNKKKHQLKWKHSRETIVYLSPRKEGQNLRHQYCKGALSEREARKYLRSLEARFNQSSPSSTPSSSVEVEAAEITEDSSSYLMNDDNESETTVRYDSFDNGSQESPAINCVKVDTSLSLRKEGRNLRHEYVKGLLSERSTRKYMKSLDQ